MGSKRRAVAGTPQPHRVRAHQVGSHGSNTVKILICVKLALTNFMPCRVICYPIITGSVR